MKTVKLLYKDANKNQTLMMEDMEALKMKNDYEAIRHDVQKLQTYTYKVAKHEKAKRGVIFSTSFLNVIDFKIF